jgi:methylated-DNA-protein-cysteine methyltransferase-like protein
MTDSFTARVYAIVKQIPAGKVATYQQVAELAGSPHAARAVGMAMKQNPDKRIVPCHRVVGADGSMHGYAFGEGIPSKVALLMKEGVGFTGNKVDLTQYLWNGM